KSDPVITEKQLRTVELAEQALDHHLESGRLNAERDEPITKELPSDESRTALQIAQAEVTRNDAALNRLAALPAAIKAARRETARALQDVGLAGEEAVRQVRPLLDAQIDAALKEENENATRRDGFVTRIDEITRALSDAISQRERLLAQGIVATRDDVEAARSHRNSGWVLVRGTYIDGAHPPVQGYADGISLPEAYEQAVIRADTLVDELSGDTERAAQLQASNDFIRTLESDRETLRRQLAEVDRDESIRRAVWDKTLSVAVLPSLAPAALRDWQALLSTARGSLENQQAKLDELEELQAVERALATQLRAAIVATGLLAPAQEVPLGTLSVMASEIAEGIRQREAAMQKAVGKETERERQRQQRVAREAQSREGLETAKEAAKATLSELLLPENADVAVARARLTEFQELTDVAARLTAAQFRQRRTEQVLAVLLTSAQAIWEALGDAAPPDLRMYSEHLSARLDTAEAVQSERALAQQAADTARASCRTHESTAARHRQTLADLCRAAAVESATSLLEAEDRSRRKREAQQVVDNARAQLASASTRSIPEVRALLAQQDTARMDADEASHSREQAQVDEEIPQARERKEQARRELDAIDASDAAAAARDAMERAASGIRANMSPWIRSKIAHAVLAEALKRFRDRAQGPMLTAASGYFERMTRGEFVRLMSDDSGKEPILIAQRRAGSRIRVDEMSEGTRDQLYLALRLAALDVRRGAGVNLPVVLDDVLMTSDEERSGAMLQALADFASSNQVIVFTHHRHIAEVAARCVSPHRLVLVPL
ncbi:MAG: hypothetical protein JWN85_1792, partial [Gammaproteobacteria bacterium]|nr:hypothetical protein [Gammaproteobacteria bacterium]